MKRVNLTTRLAVLLLAAIPFTLLSAEPVFTIRILSSESDGPVLRGEIQIQVFNPSSETWRNVNVRLDGPGGNSIERNLVQLGRIEARGTEMATTQFVFEREFVDSGEPLRWLVEYDGASSGHKEVVVTPAPEEQ